MFIINSPLFYINNSPHIGHKYTMYLMKFYTRLLSATGDNFATTTGTDEHGEKVYKSYIEHNIKNQEKKFSFHDYLRMRRDEFGKIFNILDHRPFIYHTHTAVHANFVSDAYRKLLKKGIIYKGKYQGKYSIREERYVGDDELKQMPKQEIEKFIVDKEEDGFYLKLSQEIKDKIVKNMPNLLDNKDLHVYAIQLVNNNKDVFISRKHNKEENHIPIPDHPELCFYVWFDAILYYMNVLRLYNRHLFKPYMIGGKDIMSFHISLHNHLCEHLFGYMPFKLVAHGMINFNSTKISKSYSNTLNFSKEIEKKYGKIIYSLMLSHSIGKDIELTEDAIESFITFIKNIRNCYKRIVALYEKYISRKIDFITTTEGVLNDENQIILEEIITEIYTDRESVNPSKVYNGLVKMSNIANKMITENELWNIEDEKVSKFLIVMNFIRVMIIFENILCVPGSERCLELINEKLSASLSISARVVQAKDIDIEKFNFNPSD